MSVHDDPRAFSLPASKTSLRPSSTVPPSPHLVYMRNFLRETLAKLGVSNTVLLPSDQELTNDISSGEAVILPLLSSAINALATLLDKVDTLTNRLTDLHDSVSSVANSVPNKDELTASLAPITSSVHDLSHRVSTVPLQPPRPTPPSAKPTPAPTQQKPLTSTTPGLHPDFPRFDHVTNRFYDNPESFAKTCLES